MFWESLLALKNLIELTTPNKGHDKVKSSLSLEEEIHTNQEGVVSLE
jgi:hypothetical protein